MTRHDVVVIGAGLFGSIAAQLARNRGHNVTIVDNKQPYAASKASGCVLAPSWLSSLDKQQIKGAMEVLNELYRVENLTFTGLAGVSFSASRVNPDKILLSPDIIDTVTKVTGRTAHLASGDVLRGKILVAAGAWCNELVDMPKITGLYGASIRFRRTQIKAPSLTVYRPYRQAVAINLDKSTVWFGDGTALIQKTWEKEEKARCDETLWRAHKMLGKPVKDSPYKILIGCRPYVEGHKAGYFKRVGIDVWVSTGGAKNGTVLAAWQALKFVEAL